MANSVADSRPQTFSLGDVVKPRFTTGQFSKEIIIQTLSQGLPKAPERFSVGKDGKVGSSK